MTATVLRAIDRHLGVVLTAPALVVVGVFALWPVLGSLWASLHREIVVLAAPPVFVGIDNYRRLAADPVALSSLATTLIFVVTSVAGELLLGLGLALLMHRAMPARGLYRALVLIPWAMPTVVAGQMWRLSLHDRYGLINLLLFGDRVEAYVAPLVYPAWALASIVVADVWKTSSFVALLLLAGLQMIPDDLYEAARVDGASAWQRFRRVTVPLLKPAILVAVLFRTMDAFRAFDLVYVLTYGGPGDATNMLQFHGYRTLMGEGDIGYGSAIAGVVFLLTFVVSLLYVRAIGSGLLAETRGMNVRLARVLAILAVVATVAFSLTPFVWMFLTSFKTEAEITAVPPVWLPSGGVAFYRIAIVDYGLFRFIGNSILVAGGTVLVNLVLATLAGYALARLEVPGRRLWLGLLLVISMFPQVVIAGPIWRMLYGLGLLNTYGGLIVPYVALTLPLSIWILASAFHDLPADLEESARVDGCTGLGALVRVVLPVATPALFTAAILVFIYAWNEFFFALIVMTEPGRQTLPVGIALFQGEYTVPWGEVAAASTVATVPLVVLMLIFQRRIVSGLSAGAVKG